MTQLLFFFLFQIFLILASGHFANANAEQEFKIKHVTFPNGKLTLYGVVYRPIGKGPFPAVLYNHGSAKDSSLAAEKLGPLFAEKGWVFFMPDRRGQGKSLDSGPYIMDEVNKAEKNGGIKASETTLIRLLTKDHLDDQMAAVNWLEQQNFVDSKKIAVHGNSFGGIQTILGVERKAYCAAVDASGAAQTWAKLPELQKVLISAVKNSKSPVLFFQAENDYDLSPSKVLSKAMKDSKKDFTLKFYPPFGRSPAEGHSFSYLGSSIWGKDIFEFLNTKCGNKR